MSNDRRQFDLALSLAASMFDGTNGDGETLADTETELYILGVKYKTPNGNRLLIIIEREMIDFHIQIHVPFSTMLSVDSGSPIEVALHRSVSLDQI